jgi:predicted MFS family arabinose efflux permease
MMTTMFSMLAFFIASAAYRAFRARTVQSTLLLATAVVVMLGRIPVGQAIYDRLPEVATWIMAVPNTAVQRGIIIGAALGGAATALRIVLGLDRTYMGRG